MVLDSDSDEEELLLLLALCEDNHQKSKKKRKWINDINLTREDEGEFLRLCKELESCEDKFFAYFHMSRNSFEELHDLIQKSIMKTDTNWRRSIGSRERLAICLRYLTTGETFQCISKLYRVGCSTVSSIVKQVCIAIFNNLQPEYMPTATEEIWKQSEVGYREIWEFPNCIGSIDGQHIQVKAVNTTLNCSVVLIAVIDPFCKFTIADVYSKNYEDKIIFEQFGFHDKYIANTNLPKKPLPGSDTPAPHVFIGDESFRIQPNLLRPYPKAVTLKDKFKKRFNIRLRRARRVVRRTFDILTAQWQFLTKPLECGGETAILTLRAACCLYNFVKVQDGEAYQNKLAEEEIESALFPTDSVGYRSSNAALKVREQFTAYFKTCKKIKKIPKQTN